MRCSARRYWLESWSEEAVVRFTGERSLASSVDEVWSALHDPDVLGRTIPGCRGLSPVGPGTYAATLGVQVGPVSDTYRGRFSVEGHRPTSTILVHVEGRGRVGRLELDLRVALSDLDRRSTYLRYDASARVSGLVARLGAPTLGVVGAHLTSCFFRDLDRALGSLAPLAG
jgi:carbon monoxide dehydrogenase subunit G